MNHHLDVGIDIVETDVPVKFISDKAEYGAYTLRPKITKVFRDFRDFKKATCSDESNKVKSII